jgi:hypothetical protein
MHASKVRQAGGGGLLSQLVPGYKEKIWAKIPTEWKIRKINFDNDRYEASIRQHKRFQSMFMAYKDFEQKFVPSEKFRKPAVDWRRQLTRGTLFFGRPYEGPRGSDYRPGNTFDRLRELIPYSKEEWAERKNYRTWDGMKLGFIVYGLFLLGRISQGNPVVWA